MKHEELVNMDMKDLKARLKEIGTQAQTAEGEALDALTTEAEDINGICRTFRTAQISPDWQRRRATITTTHRERKATT